MTPHPHRVRPPPRLHQEERLAEAHIREDTRTHSLRRSPRRLRLHRHTPGDNILVLQQRPEEGADPGHERDIPHRQHQMDPPHPRDMPHRLHAHQGIRCKPLRRIPRRHSTIRRQNDTQHGTRIRQNQGNNENRPRDIRQTTINTAPAQPPPKPPTANPKQTSSQDHMRTSSRPSFNNDEFPGMESTHPPALITFHVTIIY